MECGVSIKQFAFCLGLYYSLSGLALDRKFARRVNFLPS